MFSKSRVKVPNTAVSVVNVSFAERMRAQTEMDFLCTSIPAQRRYISVNLTLIYRRCAGMDVHKKSISVCARIRSAKDTFTTETAVFGTFTRDLENMAQWLRERRIQHVAMESTGVYWKPVWNVLEASKRGFALVLVNPQHIKALPGRKTDQQDAERIATYLQEGLL